MFIECISSSHRDHNGNTQNTTVFVMVDKIVCWFLQNECTKIILSTGKEVFVSNTPEQIAFMITQSTLD